MLGVSNAVFVRICDWVILSYTLKESAEISRTEHAGVLYCDIFRFLVFIDAKVIPVINNPDELNSSSIRTLVALKVRFYADTD